VLLITAFIGVYILCTSKNEEIANVFPERIKGLLFALTAAIMAACTFNIMRTLNKTVPVIITPFYNSFGGLFFIIFFWNQINLSLLAWPERILIFMAASVDMIS
jgi:drug/metabolite transporter (DMT)-like permease